MKRLLLLAVVVMVASPAHAALITSLHSTGIDDYGSPLADGMADPHYQLATNPNGTGLDTFVVRQGEFPFGYWFADSSSSKWIAPQDYYGSLLGDTPNADFVFRTTFTLEGFDPNTAQVNVKWSADNDGADVLLNGLSLNQSLPPISYYIGFSTFSVTDGFLPGVNTFDFVIHNGSDGNPYPFTGNPVGLRVELSGTATAIPEPSTLAIWSFLSLCGIGYGWRRREFLARLR